MNLLESEMVFRSFFESMFREGRLLCINLVNYSSLEILIRSQASCPINRIYQWKIYTNFISFAF